MNNNENREKLNNQIPEPGIFITKGMLLKIPEITIREDLDGKIEADPITLYTEIDLCPYWLEIAFQHLLATEKANQNLFQALKEQNDDYIGIALEEEFLAGMQAIMASAIAIDAYYGSVRDRVTISEELIRSWKNNKTARYKQVTEVLRQAFHIRDKSAKDLQDGLKQIFDFRDRAVHPRGGAAPPQLHPDLNNATDWRYVTFRFFNAKVIVGFSINVVAQTSGIFDKIESEDFKRYCEALLEKVKPLVSKWEEHYGK